MQIHIPDHILLCIQGIQIEFREISLSCFYVKMSTWEYNRVSDCCLTPKWPIFQLYQATGCCLSCCLKVKFCPFVATVQMIFNNSVQAHGGEYMYVTFETWLPWFSWKCCKPNIKSINFDNYKKILLLMMYNYVQTFSVQRHYCW